MKIFTVILVCFIIFTGTTFAILNAQPVTINYYTGTADIPLSMLMMYAFSVGLFFGLSFTMIIYFRLKRINYRLRHRVKIVEQEVENLRAIPLKDSH